MVLIKFAKFQVSGELTDAMSSSYLEPAGHSMQPSRRSTSPTRQSRRSTSPARPKRGASKINRVVATAAAPQRSQASSLLSRAWGTLTSHDLVDRPRTAPKDPEATRLMASFVRIRTEVALRLELKTAWIPAFLDCLLILA